MNEAGLNFLIGIIHESALVLAFIGSLIAIVIGLLLLVSPSIYLSVSAKLNTWISSRRSLRPMEVPRYQERHVYRRHRLIGLVITLCTLYTLYYFFIDFNPSRIEHALSRVITTSPHLVGWIVDTGSLLMVLFNLLALVIGIIILIRPSLLKGLETLSNQWVSTRHATRPLNHEFLGLDSLTSRRPRLMGSILVATGLYVLVMFTIFLI